ncbi:MAG: hypothetical protein Ct9H90mP25_4500 [Gammaproteobacteria bacterium]|nr:MAG: hypothetical protein Ct9H90mP25_4500 [Gammaproteobacteria bacterium]
MALGFAGGLIVWLFNSLFGHAENATAGGLAQWWFELMSLLGEWRDPSFVTLLVPVISIPILTLVFFPIQTRRTLILNRSMRSWDEFKRIFLGNKLADFYLLSSPLA